MVNVVSTTLSLTPSITLATQGHLSASVERVQGRHPRDRMGILDNGPAE